MAYKDTIVFSPQGKMNTDADVKSLPKGDIIDAFCCRWGIKNDGTVGAVENIKGNWHLPINMPAGNNKVIGGCADYPNNSVIYFLYNDQARHCILNLNMITRDISPILWEEPVLNFDNKYIINPHVMGGLLIWLNTDGRMKNLRIDFWTRNTAIKYKEGIGYWILTSDFVVQP
jgi:hypothetical protein